MGLFNFHLWITMLNCLYEIIYMRKQFLYQGSLSLSLIVKKYCAWIFYTFLIQVVLKFVVFFKKINHLITISTWYVHNTSHNMPWYAFVKITFKKKSTSKDSNCYVFFFSTGHRRERRNGEFESLQPATSCQHFTS